MKLITLKIPITYVDADGKSTTATEARVRAYVADGEPVAHTVHRFARRLETLLHLVDRLGDDDEGEEAG
jgi:hypothetical protein